MEERRKHGGEWGGWEGERGGEDAGKRKKGGIASRQMLKIHVSKILMY